MRIDSPILFYFSLLLPVLLLLVGWALRPIAKICLTLAMLCGALAIAGVHRLEKRDLSIVALVDVSPSTRTANFRSLEYVLPRIHALAGGRDVNVKFFANGLTTKNEEVMVDQTALPPVDADAVLLFSDGQFNLPTSYPPCYPVIDTKLIKPDDARISDIRFDENLANIFTAGMLENRTMTVDSATPSFFNPNSLSGLAVVKPDGDKVRASLNSFDPWPENDRLTAIRMQSNLSKPLFVSAASDLPREISDYLTHSAIVMPAGIACSPLQLKQINDYVQTLGGSLVLKGAIEDFPPELRRIAPVTHLPPQQKSRWVFLIDASGSMGQPTGNRTRYAAAIDALKQAIARIDDDESVSILTFNHKLNSVAESVKKSEITSYIDKLNRIQPTGETGLQSAIDVSQLGAPPIPTRLVIISDGDVDLHEQNKLLLQLIKKQWTLYLLATGENDPNPEVTQLCEATGGFTSREINPDNWPASAGKLIKQVINNNPYLITLNIQTREELADLKFSPTLGYNVFVKPEATILAQAGQKLLVTTWTAGNGKVSVISADGDATMVQQIARRLTRTPVNPNYKIEVDSIRDLLTVQMLQPDISQSTVVTVERITGSDSKKSILNIESPGVFQTHLARTEQPSVLAISVNGVVIDRRPVPGHYAQEFDQIGLNKSNLETLANRTSGKVIEPSDISPIEFASAEIWTDLTPQLATCAFALLGIGLMTIRSPMLFRRK